MWGAGKGRKKDGKTRQEQSEGGETERSHTQIDSERSGDQSPAHHFFLFFPSQRWRDAEREMKNHNVSHIDGGNFIKLRSSGV